MTGPMEAPHSEPSFMYRRGLIASGWLIATIGAVLGGSLGIAGFRSAVAGTIPLGIPGYVGGQWRWYREDRLIREAAGKAWTAT